MKNILIIEDEPLILNSLKIMLSSSKVNVDTTFSGKKAIMLLAEKKYDRIVCDLMLKDITGFDVIEESKRFYSPSEISSVFIIITAYSSKNVLDKALKYNCAIITKPFDDVDLAIEKMLSF